MNERMQLMVAVTFFMIWFVSVFIPSLIVALAGHGAWAAFLAVMFLLAFVAAYYINRYADKVYVATYGIKPDVCADEPAPSEDDTSDGDARLAELISVLDDKERDFAVS